jgi:hypothetical protein
MFSQLSSTLPHGKLGEIRQSFPDQRSVDAGRGTIVTIFNLRELFVESKKLLSRNPTKSAKYRGS